MCQSFVVAEVFEVAAKIADRSISAAARLGQEPGGVGSGRDGIGGLVGVSGEDLQDAGGDPVLGGGVAGDVEAPCCGPDVFDDVHDVQDDVDADLVAGGFGADAVDLVRVAVDEDDPNAFVGGVAGVGFGERGGDHRGRVLGQRRGSPDVDRVRAGAWCPVR